LLDGGADVRLVTSLSSDIDAPPLVAAWAVCSGRRACARCCAAV